MLNFPLEYLPKWHKIKRNFLIPYVTALICHIPCEDKLKNSGVIDEYAVRISNHDTLLNATS